MHQDPYLKTEERKRELIPILIIETGDTKRKLIIGSVPRFKSESESETDTLPPHSKYILDVLTRNLSHDTTYDVYQDDTDGSFKIGQSSFNIIINTFLSMEKSTRHPKAFGNY